MKEQPGRKFNVSNIVILRLLWIELTLGTLLLSSKPKKFASLENSHVFICYRKGISLIILIIRQLIFYLTLIPILDDMVKLIVKIIYALRLHNSEE